MRRGLVPRPEDRIGAPALSRCVLDPGESPSVSAPRFPLSMGGLDQFLSWTPSNTGVEGPSLQELWGGGSGVGEAPRIGRANCSRGPAGPVSSERRGRGGREGDALSTPHEGKVTAGILHVAGTSRHGAARPDES